MKPDWDKLMDEFKDSKSALIADVDCTAGGKALCDKVGVRGYPTIKHGDPNDLQDYNGARDFAGLKKFAEENLGPTCGPDSLDLCDEDNKALIEKFLKMDDAELKKAIEEVEESTAKIEAKAKKAIDGHQKKIDDLNKEMEKTTKKNDAELAKQTKKTGVREMRAVAAKKKKDEM